jgi:hypothetical protein
MMKTRINPFSETHFNSYIIHTYHNMIVPFGPSGALNGMVLVPGTIPLIVHPGSAGMIRHELDYWILKLIVTH